MKHLLFYDGECGLCDQIVHTVLKIDKHCLFAFAPLQGSTAQQLLQDLPCQYKHLDSFILIENYHTPYKKIFIQGKGTLRVFWLLGKGWTLIGLLSFLPSFIYDWIYRLIAKNRHRFFPQKCIIPESKNSSRFLP